MPLREAVVKAVGATGSTVTSAGLVLAGTFAVFALVSARQPGGRSIESVGFGLAVGVLLDTFVVRTVLVPAIVTLTGRFNWWPSAMGRRPRTPEIGEPTAGVEVMARSGPAD
jgi:RND superfamily putative drug exporter